MLNHVPQSEWLETRALLASGALEVQVMTQNLYMGADLAIIMGVTEFSQIPAAVSQTWDMMMATDFPARAKAMSRDIAKAGPALIALQEASYWQSMSLTDGSTTVYDFVQILANALGDRGMPYVPVSGINDLAATLPDDRGNLVTLVDRDVILARADLIASGKLQINDAQSDNYVARFPVPIPDTNLSIDVIRGWAFVDAAYKGQDFRFINTHLEVYVPAVQYMQAMELVAGPANTTLPTIIAGDFNSDAYGGAYGGTDVTPAYDYMLASGFVDAWPQTHNHLRGLTWGQSGDLRNIASTVNERIDFLFVRNGAEAQRSSRLNWNPGDRTSKPRLWPSDHAGVIATISLATGDEVFQTSRPILDARK